MKIENIPIGELKPYDKNPRKNDQAVEVVKKSIKEFGFRNPIIIDKDNVVIAGHTRLKVAIEMGIKEVPTIRAEDLSPEQVKAFRIMDNKSQEYALWDTDLLKEEFAELDSQDYDLDLTGFDLKSREVLGMDMDFEELDDVDIEGKLKKMNDVVIIQLNSNEESKRVREFLSLKPGRKSMIGEDFLKVITERLKK